MRIQPHENGSDDENERRHLKSKLGAAKYTLAPIGGPPQERGTDERLQKLAPSTLDRKDSKRETRRLQDGGLTNDLAFTHEKRDSTIVSGGSRRPGVCRVPYSRYFGPAAITPGSKHMVSVNDWRRSNPAESISKVSPAPALKPSAVNFDGSTDDAVSADKLPIYDPSDSGPVPPLILSLVQTFFLHLGSSYPFLKQEKLLNQVKEKKMDAFLVDAVCALAARFSDPAVFSGGGDDVSRSEYGHFYARRAKAATVDTFPCPSVGAVQACLLMAYEGFGANQDSALWMYLGLAIRMAVDLGLHEVVAFKFHEEEDPLYTKRQFGRLPSQEVVFTTDVSVGQATDDSANLSPSEQREIEQERIDTLWAVFALDKVVSCATGRPATFRNDEFEFGLPEPTVDPTTGRPDPYPHFVRTIHLFGQVADVLNNVQNGRGLTDEEWNKLVAVEAELSKEHRSLDQRLNLSVANFKAYSTVGKTSAYILLHLWYHALFIALHQPTLLLSLSGHGRSHQLLPNSRELSTSSAKAIADILTFAELIDPKSLIGSAFASQPIYLAACAFTTEAAASGSKPVSPTPSSQPVLSRSRGKGKSGDFRSSGKNFNFLTAASQGYQRCYNALVQLHGYWGGVESILAALDQKSEEVWTVETCTRAEYEDTKSPRRESTNRAAQTKAPEPGASHFVLSAVRAIDSPVSDLTLVYQGMSEQQRYSQEGHTQPSCAVDLGGPPQNMTLNPVYQSSYPQATTSAIRQSQMPTSQHHHRSTSKSHTPTKIMRNLDNMPPEDAITPPPSIDRAQKIPGGMLHSYTPSSHAAVYEPSPAALDARNHLADDRSGTIQYAGPYREIYGEEAVGFNGQVDVGSIGMQEVMPGWIEYLPGMNMYDGMGGG